MADIKEIIKRFDVIDNWCSDTIENDDGSKFCECIATYDEDIALCYYYADNEWSYNKTGAVSEASVLALLEALERLTEEAKRNGDSADNN